MEIRIAIVDDLEQDRRQLESCIKNHFEKSDSGSVSIRSFVSAEEFLPFFSYDRPDLLFLDIRMDEMNGIELAKQIRAQDPHVLIVFQTTEREYAFDAFPVHPFDYLIKPCRQDEVDNVLEEAVRVLGAGDPEITVNAGRSAYNVPLRTVIAVTSRGHNTELMLTGSQQLTCSESFKSISAKIGDDERFLTVNRGIMINMDHVLSPSADSIQMKDGSSYPVRVNGRAAVFSAFSQYMISRVDRRR